MCSKLAAGMAAPSVTAVTADTSTRRAAPPPSYQELAIDEFHVGWGLPTEQGRAR
jgi:hypothetical protein